MANRELTAGEKDLAQNFFGTVLGLNTDFLNTTKLTNTGIIASGMSDSIIAIARPNRVVSYNDDTPVYRLDFSLELDATAPAELAANWIKAHNFMHEMFHMYQRQLMGYDQYVSRGKDEAGKNYNYEKFFSDNVPFENLSIEQQAELIADYFLLKNGKGQYIAWDKNGAAPGGVVTSRDLSQFEDKLGDVDFNIFITSTTFNSRFDTLNPLLVPVDSDEDLETTDTYADEVKEKLENAEEKYSPLILDLGDTGIDLVSLSSGDAVYFDFNGNGFANAAGWTAGVDGFLSLDLNADGLINNGTELFGDQTGHENGFLALAAYDSNDDGAITSEDQAWETLRVWVDANQNGQLCLA